MAAAICRPEAMPPAASTGTGATASTTCGTSTIVEISPVWPPASVPCATIRSAPAATCLRACSTVPTSAATGTPAARALGHHLRRRRPERAGDQPDRVLERHVDQPGRARRGHPPAELVRRGAGHGAGPLTPYFDSRCGDEVAVPFGDGLGQPRAAVQRGRVDLAGHEHVDAVRPAAHLLVDPGELGVELLGCVRDRAEHAEAARVGDRGHHVAAVAEGEQRELDAETFADSGPHDLTLTARSMLGPGGDQAVGRVPA